MPDDKDSQLALAALLQVMRRLRDPQNGCPWDVAQSFASIAPYTLEEAYEVADAIERNDMTALRDELGDLLFQVVFHARIAEEAGAFGFADVAQGISDKLTRRHPHVFAASAQGDWEGLKAQERSDGGAHGALDGIALALPALTRAAKLGKRAARVNFDWQEATQVRSKIAEELAELDAAVAASEGESRMEEELGDLLFALAQWARHQGLDPEAALRRANGKFLRRFAIMEALLAAQNQTAAALSAAQWEALWLQAKLAERSD